MPNLRRELDFRDRLEAAALALYGAKWKRKTARFLGVGWSTFRAWGRADGETPEWAVEALEYERATRRKEIQMVDFGKVSKTDQNIIVAIAKRFEQDADKHDGLPRGYRRVNLLMDLEAAHLACPMDLDRLLVADATTFGHDLGGITRHINRETGELGGFFVPRTARKTIVTAGA